MYAKGKGSTVPSDAQAREKLALYVYEYLLHVGAQKAAQTFLSEIRWEKNITLGEPPGFLHSWWCVFWDLYCAAPERRDTCEHSSEAKAFHDYAASIRIPPERRVERERPPSAVAVLTPLLLGSGDPQNVIRVPESAGFEGSRDTWLARLTFQLGLTVLTSHTCLRAHAQEPH
ncbi:single-stranded DNA-binding protein 3 [Caerostris extrusa]|uniref:Single-stranded DNA-binding protein 3 n=1 Tax=Caerostris extrusa TaxID=172846 RepID=A0AAV4Y927_CAEEX|nr:single-stranded DNA-binding protein 3 [Caerostris extrusa]